MARKNTIRTDNSGVIHFDSRTKAVMAEVSQSQDNIKEKVISVREVVPGKSNNEIVLVLQYYDYNVEKTIQAYLEDGAKSALTEWHFSGVKAPNKRRKNRKKSGKNGADDDSPLTSPNGDITNHIGDNLTNGILELNTETIEPSDIGVETSQEGACIDTSDVTSYNSNNNALSPGETVPISIATTPNSSSQSVSPETKGSSPSTTASPSQPQRSHHHTSHQNHRQHTHSGSHSGRQRTSSEKSNIERPAKFKPHAGLEKSMKDLHRQTVSLERLRMLMNEEVDKTYKRIRSVFEEMRSCLNQRELDLIGQMDNVKAMANNTFASRQKMAADLKVLIDRSESMKEQEIVQLRADIKHFVADRKIDEELGRTTRFLYDSDFLKTELERFGEVIPVKCTYSVRRPSVSSADSGEVPVTETQPTVSESIPVEPDTSQPLALDSLSPSETHEMAELQKRLKGSLKLQLETLQGLDSTSPKEESNSTAESNQKISTASNSTSTYKDDQRRNRRRGGYRGGFYDNDRRQYYDRGTGSRQDNNRRPYQDDGSGNRPGSSSSNTVHIGRQANNRGSRGGYYRGRGGQGDSRGWRGTGRPRSPRKEGPVAGESTGGVKSSLNGSAKSASKSVVNGTQG